VGGRGGGARFTSSSATPHARWRATVGGRRRANQTGGRGGGACTISFSATADACWRSIAGGRRRGAKAGGRGSGVIGTSSSLPNCAGEGVSAGGRRRFDIAGGRRTRSCIASPDDVACATGMAIIGGGRRFPIPCGRRRCHTLMSNIPATPLLNDHVVQNGGRLAGKHHLLNRAKSGRVQKNVEPRGTNPVEPLDILAQRFLEPVETFFCGCDGVGVRRNKKNGYLG